MLSDPSSRVAFAVDPPQTPPALTLRAALEARGQALTGPHLAGLTLVDAEFEASVSLRNVQVETDSLLLWSGGGARVTLDGARAPGAELQHLEFSRRPGMLDLLPRGSWLSRVSWQGDPSRCICVAFPTRDPSDTERKVAGLDPSNGPRFGVLDEHAADMIRRIHEHATAPSTWTASYVEGLSLALSAYLSGRHGASAVVGGRANALAEHKRQALVAFVEEHVGENIGLDDLSSLAGYSLDHFSRLFKLAFGMPPHQYVLSRRVERAKALLRKPELSIAQIAIECGFANQPHLTAVFKRITGTTPAAYRRG